MDVSSVANSSSIAQVLGGLGATGGGNVTPKVQPVETAPSRDDGSGTVDAGQAREAVASVNEVVQMYNRNIEFSVDDTTGIDVVRVVDKSSDEVIRQLPVEAVIAFARTLDTLKGLLVKQHV